VITNETLLIWNEIGHLTCLLKMARNPKRKKELMREIKELKAKLKKGAGERG